MNVNVPGKSFSVCFVTVIDGLAVFVNVQSAASCDGGGPLPSTIVDGFASVFDTPPLHRTATTQPDGTASLSVHVHPVVCRFVNVCDWPLGGVVSVTWVLPGTPPLHARRSKRA